MEVISKHQAEDVLGQGALDVYLQSYWNANYADVATYKIPRDTGAQTILAKRLGAVAFEVVGCWVQITYWSNGDDVNQDLFYGYRKGNGSDLSLKDAPFHRFFGNEDAQFISIISMIFYFSWDAWVFSNDFSSIVRISNDETIEVLTASEILKRKLSSIFGI